MAISLTSCDDDDDDDDDTTTESTTDDDTTTDSTTGSGSGSSSDSTTYTVTFTFASVASSGKSADDAFALLVDGNETVLSVVTVDNTGSDSYGIRAECSASDTVKLYFSRGSGTGGGINVTDLVVNDGSSDVYESGTLTTAVASDLYDGTNDPTSLEATSDTYINDSIVFYYSKSSGSLRARSSGYINYNGSSISDSTAPSVGDSITSTASRYVGADLSGL